MEVPKIAGWFIMENPIYKWSPQLWMVYVMENPIYKWMITGGTPMTQETSKCRMTGMGLMPGGRRASPSSPTKGPGWDFWSQTSDFKQSNFGFDKLTDVNKCQEMSMFTWILNYFDRFLRISMKETIRKRLISPVDFQAQEVAAQHVAGCRIWWRLDTNHCDGTVN